MSNESQYRLRDERLKNGSTGDSSPPDTTTDPNANSNTTTDNTTGDKPKPTFDQIMASIGVFLGGAAELTDSISGAANGGNSTPTNNYNNTGQNNNTNTNKPTVSPWIIGGAITVFLLLIGLIILSTKNGNNSSNTKA